MTRTRITEDDKYLAQCGNCGTWLEVHPRIFKADPFFEVLEAPFQCCGRQQSANFIKEKDTVDFH